jgi:hypothetical protein
MKAMAKKIKVSIQDEHTLILQENAQKGDLIDLKSIHETDIDQTTITTVIKSIKDNEFQTQLQKEKDSLKKEKELEAQLKEQAMIAQSKEIITKKEQEIISLKSQIETIAKQTESDIKLQALENKQKLEEDFRQKINDKEAEINKIKHEKELNEEKLKEEIRSSQTALVSLKEMRSKMSTKMIGESLEIHCENEFNRIRSIAFPKAEFKKDNTVSASGSKGDYIYRELDDDGNEILSIMFEMKNEDELTTTKHKNKDFYKELDKDRHEKNCEYAVLVSLLEKDNEFFDDIVTIHDYPNMYVIRPQHFITMIGFLRQGNLKSQALRQKIKILNNQNIDVTNFENNMNEFKMAFAHRTDLAFSQFTKAINEIDRSIDQLNKVKENLMKSGNNLRLANNKASDLSIKKLTANSPSVAQAFEDKNHLT